MTGAAYILLLAYPVDSGFTGRNYRKVLENKLGGVSENAWINKSNVRAERSKVRI